MSDLLKKYGSRIKSLYLEVSNYSFYHNPSEIKNPDERYIGRKTMRKKLRNLITNSKTNSGAYLVTGFRGMGKTSFVNQVLFEIKNTGSFTNMFKTILGYIVAAWIASFFEVSHLITLSVFSIFLFTVVLITGNVEYAGKSKKVSIYTYTIDFFKQLGQILTHPFEKSKFINNYKYNLARKSIIFFSLLLVTNVLIYVLFQIQYNHVKEYYQKLYTYLLVLFIYFLVFGLISSSSHSNIKKKQFRFSSYDLFFLSIFSFGLFGFYFIYHFFFYTNPNIYIFISVWFIVGFAYLFRSGIKQVVHSYINNNEIIPIRLNIGKEKLSEEDILRLITYSLLDQYKKIKKPFSYFKRSVWTLSTGLFVYLVALSFYFNSNIYKLVNFWREQSHIVEYFPSQSFYKKTKENRESIFDYFNKGLYEDKNYKFLQKNDSLKISKDFHKNKEKDIIKSITHSIDYVYIHLLTSIVRPIDKLPIKSVSVNDIREKSKVKNNEKKRVYS